MEEQIANILTAFRIICSILLLFVPPFSIKFYSLYILAGISNMFDGIVARKCNSVSKFGAASDTVADICFVSICLFRLIPVLDTPFWLHVWIGIIVLIKISSIVLGTAIHKAMIAEHTFMNKITGILLFLFPIVLPIIDFEKCAFILCAVASFSAVQEGYYIIIGKMID